MCAYTRDWDESTPVDHSTFQSQPGNVRNKVVDIAERLENMIYGFIAGETQTTEGVKNLPFYVQGSDPGATADKIKAYAKDVSSKAELHLQDEDGNVIQVSNAGKLMPSFEIGSTSRDVSTASGTQEVTGLSFKPRFLVFLITLDGTNAFSVGFDDLSTFICSYNNQELSDNTFARSAVFSIFAEFGSGNKYAGKVTAVSSTSFTITWTKTGSPTGTLNVEYLAIG